MNRRIGTRLTDAKLRSVRPGSGTLTAAQCTGLLFAASRRDVGVGSWLFRFTNPDSGRRTKIKIGQYPATCLADALEIVKNLSAKIREGESPVRSVRSRQVEKPRGIQAEKRKLEQTFEVVAREFYRRQMAGGVWKNARYCKQWLRELETLLLPSLSDTQMGELRAADVVHALDPIWHKTPDTAAKQLDKINQVCTLAEALGYCNSNPVKAARIVLGPQKLKPKEQRHYPAMSWQDVPRFVALLAHKLESNTTAQAILFLILNAARSGAIRRMEWREIDFEKRIWTMPAGGEDRKTAVSRQYPLTRQALKLLRNLSRNEENHDLVFPSNRRGKTEWVLSDMSLTAVIRRHGEGFPSDIEGRLPTVHGFRSAFKNWASEHGFDDMLSETQLCHDVGNAVSQAYRRTDMLATRRNMMQRWADFVFSHAQP